MTTLKQKHFVKEYLGTGNATESAMRSHNPKDRKIASAMGTRILQSQGVQNYMQQILDEADLTDSQLARALGKIVDAGTTAKALSKAGASDGLRAVEMAYRLKDRFPAEKKKIEKKELSLKLEGKSTQELQELLQEKIEEAKKVKELFK